MANLRFCGEKRKSAMLMQAIGRLLFALNL